jgi:hypothetical protein
VTVLVRVTEDLRSAKVEGKVTVHVLLDFSKAFDLINHGLFVHELDSRYDFHTSAMGMVSSFLVVLCRLVFHCCVSHLRCFFICLSMICVLVFVF